MPRSHAQTRVPDTGVPDWPTSRVVVAGAGVSGAAAARVLRGLGAAVTVVDREAGGLGGAPVLADTGHPPAGTTLVVTSPGWRPDAPLLASAAAGGIPVWGEVELAWWLRPAGQVWLAVTGTNGKTTTTGMLAAILLAAGMRSAAAGNIGDPLVTAVSARPAYDVLAVELSSFQLHWAPSVVPAAAAIVNVAQDHLDWHGSEAAYAAAKARVWAPGTVPVFDADDPGASRLATGRPDAVGVTRGAPAPGQLGVVEGMVVDRAFTDRPRQVLAVADLRVPGPHNVTNALCAAALALAHGIPIAAVAAGLAAYAPGAHRMAFVARVGGVDYVDDSKGTNPHATAAALASYPRVVWIAGGLNKGAGFDELVAGARPNLVAAVLIGRCAPEIAEALARRAAEIPVQRSTSLDDAVREAARFARPGDTVLLSPAAASMDMFTDYADRGRAFAAAVRALAEKESTA